ncbi:MAG: SAM-dependent methyltransferase, partial [Myxococcota bacterium]
MKRVHVRGRKQSNRTRRPSKVWRVQDSFFRQAKASGYVARSIFKLQQINERFKLIQPSHRILDLGCAPGSWLQYIAEKLQPQRGGCAVGVDLKCVTLDLKSHVHVLQQDVFDVHVQTLLLLGQKN